jgi:hypothetical protein
VFHTPEESEALTLASLVESGISGGYGVSVPGKEYVGDGRPPEVLLGMGGEYEGGSE